MKRLIGMTAIAIALNCLAVLSAQAYTLNTTPLNTLGQPVGNQPVITGALPRNTTISSSINPGASSIVAATLQIHPNYTPPVLTTPVITGGLPRNTTISSSINPGASSIVATTLQIHPNYTPPVLTTPVITGALPRNTTISSSINPGASSIVATTLQIHPNYTPPLPTTPVNSFGRPVPVISSNSEFSSLNIPKISPPIAIGAPTIRIPVSTTVGSIGSYGDGATPGPGGSAGYPDNGGAVSSLTGWSGFSSWFTPNFAARGFSVGW
jgi:hypothetical protein